METLQTAVENILGRTADLHTPGCALLLARDGEVLCRAAAGMADLELGRAAGPDDNFIIASNTKQFACLAILMLRDRGLLDLDEPITRFFPDFPAYRDQVTIRMLMCHTSGIREYFEGYTEDSFLRTADAVAVLHRIRDFGPETLFAPGSAWSYCNSGYVMLGEIVRQLSGLSFGSFVEREIFAPLGMVNSRAPDDPFDPDPRRVVGYVESTLPDGSGRSFQRQPYDMLEVGFADGNIASNVDDLLCWHRFLYGSDGTLLLKSGSLQEFFRPFPGTNYGLGLFLGPQDKAVPFSTEHREIWHTGSTPGFISRVSRFPDEKISAIMLTNWDGIERDRLFFSVLDELFRSI